MTLPWFFSPSWTMLGGSVVAVAAVAFPFGAYVGAGHEKDKATAALLKATEHARQVEANWATNVAALEEVHADEVRSIAAQRDAALSGLRNRPERPVSAASAPSAQYATGANLYRDDAAFLVGFASSADRLRAALDRCEAWIAQVTHPGLAP